MGAAWASFKKTAEWEYQGGKEYEGTITVVNRSSTTVTAWRLECDVRNVTWMTGGTPTHIPEGWTVVHPEAWQRILPPGARAMLRFGGRGHVPKQLVFVQLSPPVQQPPSDVRRGTFGPKVFAPAVDASAYPATDLLVTAAATGHPFFMLASLVSCAGQPAWAGVRPLEFYLDAVQRLRQKGGDVIVSFGGRDGTDLAHDVPQVDALARVYTKVVDTYKAAWVAFDLEAEHLGDAAAVHRRNEAIARVQQRCPGLVVMYCLPADPAVGLSPAAIDALKSAGRAGARVHVVAIKAMDFGDAAAPNPAGRMADYVYRAVVRAQGQVLELDAQTQKARKTQLGVIPRIGVNGVESEVVGLEDARLIARFAARAPWIRFLGYWCVERDRDDGCRHANAMSSGVAQHPLNFFEVLATNFLGTQM